MQIKMLPNRMMLVFLVLSMSACISSGNDDSSIALFLMDGPPEGVTSVILDIDSMEVHVIDKDDKDDKDDKKKESDPNDDSIDDDDKWETLDVGESIDLVNHQGEDNAKSLGDLGLPEGKITQIRLKINIEGTNTTTANDTVCDLDLSKVEKKGVKINHPFKALETQKGDVFEAYIDFELEKSLKETGNDCYRLEPHLKLVKVKKGGNEIEIGVD